MNLLNIGLGYKNIEINQNDYQLPFILLSNEYNLQYLEFIIDSEIVNNDIEIYENLYTITNSSQSQIINIDLNKSIYDFSGNKNNMFLLKNNKLDYIFNNGIKYNYENNNICIYLNNNEYNLDKYLIYIEQISMLNDYDTYDFYYNTLNTLPNDYIVDLIGIQTSQSSYSSYNIMISNSSNTLLFNVGINETPTTSSNNYLSITNSSQILNGNINYFKTYVDFYNNNIYYNSIITSSSSITTFLENNINNYISLNAISNNETIRANNKILIQKIKIINNPNITITTSSKQQNYVLNNNFIENILLDKNNIKYDLTYFENKYNNYISMEKNMLNTIHSLKIQVDPIINYLESSVLNLMKEINITYSQKTQIQMFIPNGDIS